MDQGQEPAPEAARYLAEIGASGRTAEDLVMALTRRGAGEGLEADGILLQPELLDCIPEALALEHGILPLHRAAGILFVAVPADRPADPWIRDLERQVGARIEPVAVRDIDVRGVFVKARQLLRRRRASGTIPRSDPPAAREGPPLALSELGMPEAILSRLRKALGEPQGLLLLAGPARSGRSTSLLAIAGHLRRQNLRVAMIDESQGLEALEGELSLDPDAVVVDGTRSPAAANQAVRAALEGRRIVISLEAADGIGALARLADLKVDAHLIDRALRAGLSQRLVRRLCPDCRESYRENPATLEDLRLDALLRGIPLYRAPGCGACAGTGYRGRVGLYEYGDRGPDRSMRSGFQPLVADALAKLLSGLTSLGEIADQVPFTQLLQAADRLDVRRLSP